MLNKQSPDDKSADKISPDKASLARNPHLQKHWLTRILARGIITGATMNETAWKTTTKLCLVIPMICALFIYIYFTEPLESYKRIFVYVFVGYVGVFGLILVFAARYGYKHRDEIDTAGVRQMGLKGIGRYAAFGAMIAPAAIAFLSQLDW